MSSPPHPVQSPLAIHRGAIDKKTVTSSTPSCVMDAVRKALDSMGVEIYIEGLHKFRCVRARRRADAVTAGCQHDHDHDYSHLSSDDRCVREDHPASWPTRNDHCDSDALRLITLPDIFSDASSVDSNPGPSSQRTSLNNQQTSRSANSSISSECSVLQATSSSRCEPVYGREPGGEIRFSVELTKLDGLADLYSLDIRRLSGCFRSYKFVYDTLRE